MTDQTLPMETSAKPPPVFPAPSIEAGVDASVPGSLPVYIPPSPDAGRAWTVRLGLAVDRLLNVVLLNGDDTWTISLHAAVAQHRGKRWGCVLCALLSGLVQHDHCAVTLDPTTQETTGAAIKAGALMALIITVLVLGLRLLFQTII